MRQARRPRGDRAAPKKSSLSPDHETRLARIESLARSMDSQFRIPGTGVNFGFDALAGFVPGIGDVATSFISGYIVYEAWKLGLPRHKLVRMAGNLGVDTVIGTVPLLGDVFDVAWKANLKNAKIIRDHLQD